MSCYISSNDNRIYLGLEADYGEVAEAAEASRIPAGRLRVRQLQVRPPRRDKTGSRTFGGWPSGLRCYTSYELSTYLTEWKEESASPVHDAAIQSTLGAAPLYFAGMNVQSTSGPLEVAFGSAHGLTVGQAVTHQGEIRFVAAVPDDTSIVLNAPFTGELQAGEALGRTMTYSPATSLPSFTAFDYWSPAEAVQRLVAGCAVDEMRIRVNGDFHQFDFSGVAADLLESATFSGEQAGLAEFPPEPEVPAESFALVPGSLGQAWIGVEAARFHTLLEADVLIRNNLDTRSREFGFTKPRCVAPGERDVSVDLHLVSDADENMTNLYLAARQRVPMGVMFQLGQQNGLLCGVYMPAVVAEIPEFDDERERLEWRLRGNRAQGTINDEIFLAFG